MVGLYIGFGSNIEPREQWIRKGKSALEAKLGKATCSPTYESSPMGKGLTNSFLNGVWLFGSIIPPSEVLTILRDAEQQAGRTRTAPARENARRSEYRDRTLDLDLLLYGDRVVDDTALTVPHPALHLRKFVLVPLLDLSPHLIHPRLGVPIMKILQNGDFTGQCLKEHKEL